MRYIARGRSINRHEVNEMCSTYLSVHLKLRSLFLFQLSITQLESIDHRDEREDIEDAVQRVRLKG